MEYEFRTYANHNKPTIPSTLRDTIDYHELTICLSGQISYTINNKYYSCESGDIIYLSPNSKRIRTSETSCCYISINFFAGNNPLIDKNVIKNCVDKTLIQIFKLLDDAYITRNFEKFTILIQYIIAHINQKLREKNVNPTVLSIKNFILNHIRNPLTVSDVASSVFLSKEYCEAMFKRETGTTIINFINKEKVSLAQNLILQQEHSLKKISEIMGFSDYNYFSRVFKQYTGKSPLQFKNLK